MADCKKGRQRLAAFSYSGSGTKVMTQRHHCPALSEASNTRNENGLGWLACMQLFAIKIDELDAV